MQVGRLRGSWHVLTALLAVATVSASLTSADAYHDSSAAQASTVTLAHLRLSISTTSDWTQVQLKPGQIIAQHVSHRSGVGVARGLGFVNSAGTSTQTVDLVYSETSRASRVHIEIDKGFRGKTSVAITNLNTGKAASVTSLSDTRHSPTDGSNRLVTSVSRSSIMSTAPMREPYADSRRLVLAFYYPWYFQPGDPHMADHPATPRSPWSPGGVNSMTAQAKDHGVNGFIVSWAGDQANGSAFDIAARAAVSHHQLITGYLETGRAEVSSTGIVNPLAVRDWLAQLLQRSSSPAFLKASDGVPVVFVFDMAKLLPVQWASILTSLRSKDGLNVHLVGDDTDSPYLPYEWGTHRYAVTASSSQLAKWSQTTSLRSRAESIVNPAIAPKLFAGTASPGYDDHRLRGGANPVIPRSGSRFAATWRAAETGGPDWMLVTSWNEWYEGTEIEPGMKTGSAALTETAKNAAAWRNSS